MVSPSKRPTAVAVFWSCYLLVMMMFVLACWPTSSKASEVAIWPPGTRCLMTLPGSDVAPAVVKIGNPMRLVTGAGERIPGYSITPPSCRSDLVGVWIAAASSLTECRP